MFVMLLRPRVARGNPSGEGRREKTDKKRAPSPYGFSPRTPFSSLPSPLFRVDHWSRRFSFSSFILAVICLICSEQLCYFRLCTVKISRSLVCFHKVIPIVLCDIEIISHNTSACRKVHFQIVKRPRIREWMQATAPAACLKGCRGCG